MTRYISTADTAKVIRTQLKANFPGIKFSVRSKTYSGGSSISIDWTDGPTQKEVESITNNFQGASFDGMTDMKSYHDSEWNGEKVYWGANYVFTSREYSLEIYTQVVNEVAAKYGQELPEVKQNTHTWKGKVSLGQPHIDYTRWQIGYDYNEDASVLIHREICQRSFYVHPAQSTKEVKEAAPVAQPTDLVEDVTVTENEEKDGVEVRFPEKPAQEVLEPLKEAGFRWSRFNKCWYAKRSGSTLAIAYSLVTPEMTEEEMSEAVEQTIAALGVSTPEVVEFTPQTTEQVTATNSNLSRAESLRNKADAMQEQIDYKKNPAVSSQNPTKRRADIGASMYADAQRMERLQSALYTLADTFESGTTPQVLRGVSSKAQLEVILTNSSFPSTRWSDKEAKTLTRIGINPFNFPQAKAALTELVGTPQPKSKDQLIREKERELIGTKIPGYFPTPKPVVEEMLELADIKSGMTVLEPSAGKGNIADEIAKIEGVNLSVVECSYTLREVLEFKGYKPVASDFLSHQVSYDRIIMNPPFENGQDIEHVRHAYKCLTPGGRLVAIMSESGFFRSEIKYEDFRDWLDGVKGSAEKLPEGSFLKSEVSTGVNTRIVVISKPAKSKVVEFPCIYDAVLSPSNELAN